MKIHKYIKKNDMIQALNSEIRLVLYTKIEKIKEIMIGLEGKKMRKNCFFLPRRGKKIRNFVFFSPDGVKI